MDRLERPPSKIVLLVWSSAGPLGARGRRQRPHNWSDQNRVMAVASWRRGGDEARPERRARCGKSGPGVRHGWTLQVVVDRALLIAAE